MKPEGILEFLGVVEAGSFTGAAKNLKVSVAHVSRRIASLEAVLGVKLMVRSTRSLTLTETGQAFFERCKHIRDDLDEAVHMTASASQRLEGRIRIAAVSGSFAELVIAPTLAIFAREHPNIELDIDYSPRKVDIKREGFDFAIRSGPLEDSDLIAKPLCRRITVAAASPEYLEKRGEPNHPSELKQHDCLLTGRKIWRFLSGNKSLIVHVDGRLTANNGDAIRHACEQGLGIAYMASAGYRNSLSEGRLKPILQNHWNDQAAMYLLYPDKHFIPKRVSLAMQILLAASKKIEQDEQTVFANIKV